MDAGERLLSLAIGLIDHATARASAARVARIDCNNRNAGQLRLVRQELAELGKRPPMQTAALCFPGLNPLANVRQVLDGNRKSGAFGARNDLLGDAVVDVLAEASLLSAEFLQSPFGGLGASALQSSTTAGEALADTLDLGAGVGPPEIH